MSHAVDLLVAEIQRQGPISFQRFMEIALYCPEFGYYEQFIHTPGRAGDFFTSVSVGRVFGQLLASQIIRWADSSLPPHPRPWQIVEAGAHDGRLTADLLDSIAHRRPDLLSHLRFVLVEPSARHQAWQQETLRAYPDLVEWTPDWTALTERGVQGVIIANELLDALPVRRLGWDRTAKNWFEWGVHWNGTRFVDFPLPAPSNLTPPIRSWLAKLEAAGDTDAAGSWSVEIPEAAIAWWHDAARALRYGHLVALDYGLEDRDWAHPSRRQGTLRAYRRHQLADSVLDHPGEQDLTAHVNWSLIRAAGEAEGLLTAVFLPQGRWLERILAAEIAKSPDPFGWSATEIRQFHTLSHPSQMGSRFQVLVQSRSRLQPAASSTVTPL